MLLACEIQFINNKKRNCWFWPVCQVRPTVTWEKLIDSCGYVLRYMSIVVADWPSCVSTTLVNQPQCSTPITGQAALLYLPTLLYINSKIVIIIKINNCFLVVVGLWLHQIFYTLSSVDVVSSPPNLQTSFERVVDRWKQITVLCQKVIVLWWSQANDSAPTAKRHPCS